MKSSSIALSVVLALSLSACATHDHNPTGSPTVGEGSGVSYGDERAVETVTTDLGSTDIQITTEKMVQSMLVNRNVQRVIDQGGILVASPVKNKTSEYFDTKLITDAILVQLGKSGVRYAVESSEMQNQVDELYRQNNGLYQKPAQIGKMQGAHFRIDGSVSSIEKRNANVRDVWYVINLRLIGVESGLIEWSEEKQIRKTVRR